MTTKNLVMGFATNQTELSVRVFCRSLREVYPQNECDVVIVTNAYEPYFTELADIGIIFASTPNNYSARTTRFTKLANRALLHGFKQFFRLSPKKWLREISQAYPILIETWHHPQLARWFAYRRILSVNKFYGQIFLADVKDVVFQAPFFACETEDKITLFADANLYGECRWNDMWYRDAYGATSMRSITGTTPACIGTVLGSQCAMQEMLDEFTTKMAKSPFGRIEQAIFNHMVHTGELKTAYEMSPNITGVVATLGSEAAYASVKIIDGTICRAMDNSVIPVVHMYDRWAGTAQLCAERFAK